jgi:hypothetical protein
MGKNSENFKQSLSEMKKFLTSRQQFSVLANKCEVSLRTVYNTFEAESFEDLKGKQINVYRAAIELVNEIKSLPHQADAALK